MRAIVGIGVVFSRVHLDSGKRKNPPSLSRKLADRLVSLSLSLSLHSNRHLGNGRSLNWRRGR